MNHSTVTETEYQVGDLVEIHAEICRTPCQQDCGCGVLVARNGHVGAVLNVQPPLFGGEPYYQVDGIDMVLYGTELRAVQP